MKTTKKMSVDALQGVESKAHNTTESLRTFGKTHHTDSQRFDTLISRSLQRAVTTPFARAIHTLTRQTNTSVNTICWPAATERIAKELEE